MGTNLILEAAVCISVLQRENSDNFSGLLGTGDFGKGLILLSLLKGVAVKVYFYLGGGFDSSLTGVFVAADVRHRWIILTFSF